MAHGIVYHSKEIYPSTLPSKYNCHTDRAKKAYLKQRRRRYSPLYTYDLAYKERLYEKQSKYAKKVRRSKSLPCVPLEINTNGVVNEILSLTCNILINTNTDHLTIRCPIRYKSRIIQ